MNTERLSYLLDEINHEINRLRTEMDNMARGIDGGACSAPPKEWPKPDDPMFVVRGPWNNWGRWDFGDGCCVDQRVVHHGNGFTAECGNCGEDLT